MKTILKPIALTLLTLITISCGNDDNNETQNQAPEAFSLIAVTNASEADRNPTLSWEAATDPDGDEVTYELTLQGEVIYTGTNTSFEVTEALAKATLYSFSVTASNSNGGLTQADNSAGDGTEEAFTTNSNYVMRYLGDASFAGRAQHSGVVFGGELWIFGGSGEGNTFLNDVWSSNNGIDWTQKEDFATNGVYGHSSVVFNNNIYIVGGLAQAGITGNVHYTEDNGSTWSTDAAGLDPRYNHKCVVKDNLIYLIGGESDSGGSDRMRSWNGVLAEDWGDATLLPSAEDFYRHGAVIYPDGAEEAIWIVGGYSDDIASYRNTVYSTTDMGLSWNSKATLPLAVGYNAVTVFDGKIWSIGGVGATGEDKIFYYTNTDDEWTALPTEDIPAEFTTSRNSSEALVMNDRLYIIGGSDGGIQKNDVFVIE